MCNGYDRFKTPPLHQNCMLELRLVMPRSCPLSFRKLPRLVLPCPGCKMPCSAPAPMKDECYLRSRDLSVSLPLCP